MPLYTKLWVEELPCYDYSHVMDNHSKKAKSKYGCGINNLFIFGKQGSATLYVENQELETISEWGYKFYSTKSNFKLVKKESQKSITKLKKHITNLLKECYLNSKNLGRHYTSYTEELSDLFVNYFIIEPFVITKIEEELCKEIEKMDNTTKQELREYLNTPNNKILIDKDSILAKKNFTEIDKEKLSLDANLINKFYKKVNAQKVLTPQINIRVLAKAEIIRHFKELKMELRCNWMMGMYYFNLFIKAAQKEYGLGEEIKNYSGDELENLFLTGRKAKNRKLEERAAGYLVGKFGKKKIELTGKEASIFLKTKVVKKKIPNRAKQITGNPACSGKIAGEVIIISYNSSDNHQKKIDKMKVGQIIVTEMTRPNIIAACRKAGGDYY